MNNSKTDHERREQMMARLLAAQTPWGRAWLNSRANSKRWVWNIVVGATHVGKRAFDLGTSAAALLVLAPAYLLIALLVKLDGGPVFFRQTRIGLNGRPFLMLKFRSMVVDAEARLKDLLARNEKASGVTFKMKDDPRITQVGRLLRVAQRLDAFGKQRDPLVRRNRLREEVAPAVFRQPAGEEAALAAELHGFLVEVVHEFVDERESDELDLVRRLRELADEDVAAGVDPAFGF